MEVLFVMVKLYVLEELVVFELRVVRLNVEFVSESIVSFAETVAMQTTKIRSKVLKKMDNGFLILHIHIAPRRL